MSGVTYVVLSTVKNRAQTWGKYHNQKMKYAYGGFRKNPSKLSFLICSCFFNVHTRNFFILFFNRIITREKKRHPQGDYTGSKLSNLTQKEGFAVKVIQHKSIVYLIVLV